MTGLSRCGKQYRTFDAAEVLGKQYPAVLISSKEAEPCAADDPLNPVGGCPYPAAGYVRAGCVHEHIREGWLCEEHLERMESAFCRVCHELGHDCELIQ